jgi:hypothetical protein
VSHWAAEGTDGRNREQKRGLSGREKDATLTGAYTEGLVRMKRIE